MWFFFIIVGIGTCWFVEWSDDIGRSKSQKPLIAFSLVLYYIIYNWSLVTSGFGISKLNYKSSHIHINEVHNNVLGEKLYLRLGLLLTFFLPYFLHLYPSSSTSSSVLTRNAIFVPSCNLSPLHISLYIQFNINKWKLYN